MSKRFAAIWFMFLRTDWLLRKQPGLAGKPVVTYTLSHGKMIITSCNKIALSQDIKNGDVVADARAVLPGIVAIEEPVEEIINVLQNISGWFIRYSPEIYVDAPEGLFIDTTGCTHLWGGEEKYLQDIKSRLQAFGYTVRTSMADTMGAAWAESRLGRQAIIPRGEEAKILSSLPAIALRIETAAAEKLYKLGLTTIGDFMHMPHSVLRKRFGESFVQKLRQALGVEEEYREGIHLKAVYEERLNCIEPISTRTDIEIALRRLIETICQRLKKEQKGARQMRFSIYKTNGKEQTLTAGTHRPTRNANQVFLLFDLSLQTLYPSPGIELFLLEIPVVEDLASAQEQIWNEGGSNENVAFLLDKMINKVGEENVTSYLPAPHHWPERSVTRKNNFLALPVNKNFGKLRPVRLLAQPQEVKVTAPIPDYPPMLFIYKEKIHKVVKADGPERIEAEWWIQEGLHRDYYAIEDEEGCRYWLFRAGHYNNERPVQWFLHGFFA